MNGFIERVTGLVAPPPDVTSVDQVLISQALGTDLPADYLRLAELYGSGQFDDYLYLLAPFASNRSYDLVREARLRQEALAGLWSTGEPRPALLEPPGTSLMPWASTDNGEYVYWLCPPGSAPSDWTVVVNAARSPDWEHFPVGCAEFLAGVLDGTLHSSLFWDDFPTDPHDFTRLDA